MNEIMSMLMIPQGLASMIQSGGSIVTILLIISIFVMTIIILKFFQFLFSGLIFRKSSNSIIKLWISGRHQEAYNIVAKRKSPTSRVLTHLMRGLDNPNLSEKLLREDIERVATNYMSATRSYFKAIEAVVQIAPLLGLFGTVIGMIEAFQKLQSVGSEVDPSVLAGGIWVALLTTAVGLAVAIPSAFVLYWLEAIANKEQESIETSVTSILTKRGTEEITFANGNSAFADNIKPINNAAE